MADENGRPGAGEILRRIESLERGDAGSREKRLSRLEESYVSQKTLELTIKPLVDDMAEIKSGQRLIRNLVISSLLSAVTSLIVAIILNRSGA